MTDVDLSGFVVADDELAARVRAALKRKRKFSISALADDLDASPKRVREALAKLREAGFRIPEETDGQVELVTIPPTSGGVHKLPLELLSGDRIRFGVVSDTHLGSSECALPELHLAYDHFEREGIGRVLHAGDLVAGVGIFKGQHNYLTHHTFEAQVAHAVADFPKRTGIVTDLIGGNHDLEGEFGKSGADPCRAVANQRPDIAYLGAYSAFLGLANGAHVHMLHGRGGGAYALSYKLQKIIQAYPAGRKPAALIMGHFHVQANLSVRGVQGQYPGCFEWSSAQFGDRLGLTPDVGFHVVEATLGDDGSIVRWRPEWLPIYEGRVLAA